jgi:hypothetical protein
VSSRSLATDILIGAAAGIAATWLMGKTTTLIFERQSKSVHEREKSARGGESAYAKAADKVAGVFGMELSDQQKQQYGKAIHWALGVGSAALYGAAQRRVRNPSLASGLLFGGLVWLIADEILNPALDLTPGPAAFPWQTHARGLASHLVYGAATSSAFRAIESRAS